MYVSFMYSIIICYSNMILIGWDEMSYKLQVIISDELEQKLRNEAKKSGVSLSALSTMILSDGMRSRENQDVMKSFSKIITSMSDADLVEQLKKMSASDFMEFNALTEGGDKD